MLNILHNLRLSIDEPEEAALVLARKKLGLPEDFPAFIYRKSLDARKGNIAFIYSVALEHMDSSLSPFPSYDFTPTNLDASNHPYIIGFGPAGMFCALTLLEYGITPVIIERGEMIEKRIETIKRFWEGGALDPDSNVQFGEGGAGSFSDGKLTTRINDPRIRKILEMFVENGAPEDILYLAKPHIGTDILRTVVKNIRNKIISQGGKIYYSTRMSDIRIENGILKSLYINNETVPVRNAVLAMGSGIYEAADMLFSKPLTIIPKPFSVGFRIEHLQEDLNFAMYGKYAAHPALKNADYTFSNVTDKKKGEAVYSFCMCPGGEVINSSFANKRLLTNGMSYYSRSSKNSNAAILASVSFTTPKEGLLFRDNLQKSAYNAANGSAPISTENAFITGKTPIRLGKVKPTFLPSTTLYDLNLLFPEKIAQRLREGLLVFGKNIIHDPEAVLTGIETTSSPLRILRDSSMQAIGASGLYPCGEGAGYSGGIMSSAVDGMKAAEMILTKNTL